MCHYQLCLLRLLICGNRFCSKSAGINNLTLIWKSWTLNLRLMCQLMIRYLPPVKLPSSALGAWVHLSVVWLVCTYLNWCICPLKWNRRPRLYKGDLDRTWVSKLLMNFRHSLWLKIEHFGPFFQIHWVGSWNDFFFKFAFIKTSHLFHFEYTCNSGTTPYSRSFEVFCFLLSCNSWIWFY